MTQQSIAGIKPQQFATMILAPSLMQERRESLKAGVISGVVTSSVWLLGTVVFHGLLGFGMRQSLLAAGIAGGSGLLFGLTYRYVIRHDRNPHLKSGAVGAFALVRGFAQAEPLLLSAPMQWQLLLFLLGQNFLMFTLARWLLDQAYDRGWLRRFPMTPMTTDAAINPELIPHVNTDASTETSLH